MKILTQFMRCGLFDDDKYTIYACADEKQGLAIAEMLRNRPNVIYVGYFRYQAHLLQIDYIGLETIQSILETLEQYGNVPVPQEIVGLSIQ